MKKILVIFIGLLATGLTSQAQLENYRIYQPAFDGGVFVTGAVPVYTPVVYDQPVMYNAPVQYYAPVVYNGPVFYNTGPAQDPVVCGPSDYDESGGSSVQVIRFGEQQARQQGYQFGRR